MISPQKFTLLSAVAKYLSSQPDVYLTARQIATWIFRTYPEACEAKRQRSRATKTPLDTDDALIQQLVAEIGAGLPQLMQRYPSLQTTADRPRLYVWHGQAMGTDSDTAEEAAQQDGAESEGVLQSGHDALGHHAVPSLTQVQNHGEPPVPLVMKPSDHEVERPVGRVVKIPAGRRHPDILLEEDLYPLLGAFLASEYGLYTQRIDEKRSRNTQGTRGNEWLFPDLVALQNLSAPWNVVTRACAGVSGGKRTKLWSFEVKRVITRSDIRHDFFQAVSNSSWANYAYLVAARLEGADTRRELEMLSALHGVGFILLDQSNPTESQVLIPARERPEIDWNVADRLTHENPDFKDFLQEVTSFYQTNRLKPSDWSYAPSE